MDFIKKHFEKLFLAGSLLVLIGCAAYLGFQIAKLNEEIQSAPQKARNKSKDRVATTPTAIYSNTLTSLQVPPLWQTNNVDPFQTRFATPPPEIVIITNRPSGPVVALVKIIPQPFKLKFQSYKNQGEDFAINFITRNKTFFIKKIGMEIADQFERTGFFITKFEKKTAEIYNKSLNVTNKIDVSELTIEKADAPPILLVIDKIAQERESVAVVLCLRENQEVRIRKNDAFTCSGKSYKVIDITRQQVLIEDSQSKEKHTISLPGVKE
jgi:hypothetical protein